MDNEKKNDLEMNTPKDDNEVDAAPITADDLIKRLKMNLMQNPKLQGEELFENSVEHEEDKAEEDDAVEESDTATEDVPSLEEVAQPVEEEKIVESQTDKKPSVTESVKMLIASLRSGGQTDVAGDEEPEGAFCEDETPKESALGEKIVEEDKVDEPVVDEPILEEPVTEEPDTAVKTEPEREYSVVIEKSSDKTNVFDPLQLKQMKKSADMESLFEDNEQPAVAEAEQLTFSMTEDDLQKSIEEAEAFIFEREYIDNPEEVINGTENVPDENILDDPDKQETEYDQTDLWIASAFGDEDEIKSIYGEEKAQEIQTQLDIDVQEYLKSEKKQVMTTKLEEEYTSVSQTKEIFASYRKAHKIGLFKMIACFVVMLVALWVENTVTFGGILPGALNQQNYPVVYILASLQFLVIASAFAWRSLYNGIRSLLVLRPVPESIPAVVVLISAVYHTVHCFVSETDPAVSLYVFPVILCVFLTLVYDFISLKREIYSFNIVASKRMKYTINHVETEGAKLENEAFGDYISEEEDISMFKIGKTGFVKGFFGRMNAYPKNYMTINILLSVAVALALVFFIVATVVYNVKTAFSFGYLAFILAVPFCSLISFGLPFYRASKKAFDDDSAIIGNVSLDEYAHATTLSFDDKDVFPSYGVKVKSIKVYGESRIDKILYNAASIFNLIGGPLSDVFDTATHELGNSDNIEIIEIAKDGIESIIDGQHVYLGKASYIKSRGCDPVSDPDDDALETAGEASIMYMVCDDEISAKMYVQYTIDPDFEFTLRKLYKAWICIGIKTLDPNIDDKLLGSKVKITKYPVRILRCSSLDEAASAQDEADSGIVSKGSPRALLNAFVLCSKVLYANKTNMAVKMLSIAFSILLMAFLLVFGEVTSIPSVYVVLYQLFWMIPVYLISKFYV